MQKIELTRGFVAFIDDEDFERVSLLKWQVTTRKHYTPYAKAKDFRVIGERWIKMHRFILRPPEGVHIDHIDGNGLNNCKSNLRLCTRSQNLRNRHNSHGTSSYLGVCYTEREQMWRATCDGRGFGYFHSEIEAALAYDRAALKIHGEFAKPNFPEVA